MRAGACSVKITPPAGSDLSGYVAREQPSIGVHDDLYAHALYLEGARGRLLWLHADLLGFAHPWALKTRQALANALGLRPAEVTLSATHTHSGPPTLVLRECGSVDPAYLESLRMWLHEAARAAMAEPTSVTLRFAETQCTLGVDRRRAGPLSHVDSTLPVLALQRTDGTYLAVIANYGMHNVALRPSNRLVSADIAGAAAQAIASGLPGSPVVLFTNGAAGNVNPPPDDGTYGMVSEFGQRLARAALDALAEAEVTGTQADLAVAGESVTLPLSVLSAEEVEAEYRRALAENAEEGGVGERIRSACMQWRDVTLAALNAGRAPTGEVLELQVIRMGPVRFVCMGAEVFSHMPPELRQACGERLYVVGYANGDCGYLPPEAIYEEGGYEVAMAYKYYGCFAIAPGGYEKVRAQAIGLVERISL